MLGYSQIPGVNFTDNSAPIVNDITFCLMLSNGILYGELEDEIYMETLAGYAK